VLRFQVFFRMLSLWALLLVPSLASARTLVHAETRVGVFEVAAEVCNRVFGAANSSGHQENVDASTEDASRYPHAARAIPTLMRGPGGKMLGEAVGHLKGLPGAQRVAAFENFAAQITKATNGQWTAKAFNATNARVFAGEGGEALVFDAAGNMFRGNLSNRAAFAFGEGGSITVAFDLLKAL
jgi:hypothetical protein